MYSNSWGHYVVCYCTECCNYNCHNHNLKMSSYPYDYCKQFEESPSSSTNCGFGRSYTKLTIKKPINTINDTATVSAKSSTKLKKKSAKITKKAANTGVNGSERSNARNGKYNVNSASIDQMTHVNSTEYITTLNGNNVTFPYNDGVGNVESKSSKTCNCCHCKNVNNRGSITDFITKNGLPLTSDQNISSNYPIKYNSKKSSSSINSAHNQNRTFQNHATKSQSNFQEKTNDSFHMIQRQPSNESHGFCNKPYKPPQTDLPNSNQSSYCCVIPAQDSQCSLTKSGSFTSNLKCLSKFPNKCNCCNCNFKSSKQYSKAISQPGQTSKIQQPQPAFKSNTASSKSNPQLGVINEETEADDISNYNYSKQSQPPINNPSNVTTNKSGRFENFKESVLNNNSSAAHKSFEDSCADFLNIICDSILESVEKSLDTKLQNYCCEITKKIECLNCKFDNNEHKMEKLHCDLMEKMSIQNENYQRQFSLLLKFLVENHSAKETCHTSYEDKESQCNIKNKEHNKDNEVDPIKEAAAKSDVLPAVNSHIKSDSQCRCCDSRSKIFPPTLSTHSSKANNFAQVKPTISNANNIAAGVRCPSSLHTSSAAHICPSPSHNSTKDQECYDSDNDECDKENCCIDNSKYFNQYSDKTNDIDFNHRLSVDSFSHLTTFTTGPHQKQFTLKISTENTMNIICHKCHNNTTTCNCESEELQERDDIFTDDENWETSGYATDPEDNGGTIKDFGRNKIQKKSKKKHTSNSITANLGSGKSKSFEINQIRIATINSRSPTRLSRL